MQTRRLLCWSKASWSLPGHISPNAGMDLRQAPWTPRTRPRDVTPPPSAPLPHGRRACGWRQSGWPRRLRGCGVAAHAGGPVLDLDHAAPPDPHPLPRFEADGHGSEHPGQDRLRLGFRQPVFFTDAGRQVLQRDRDRRCRLRGVRLYEFRRYSRRRCLNPPPALPLSP